MSTLTGLISGGGGGSFSNIQTDTASGSFTLPVEIIRIAIACVAGGGGGRGVPQGAGITDGGHGGNGGSGFVDTFLVPAGTTVHYVLGAGGSAGYQATGGDGGNSYVWLVDSAGNKRMVGGVTGGAGGVAYGSTARTQPNTNDNCSNGLSGVVLVGGAVNEAGNGSNGGFGRSGEPVNGRGNDAGTLSLSTYPFNTAGAGDIFSLTAAQFDGNRRGGSGGGSSLFAIGGQGGGSHTRDGAGGSRGSGGGGGRGSGSSGGGGGAGYIEIYY